MKKLEQVSNRIASVFAAAILKAGIAASNSACRFGYYQNQEPAAMKKFKK